MPPTPIIDAISIVWGAIYAALDPLTAVPIYWASAAEGINPPFIVGQSQDNGGRAEKHLNGLGWSGLITIKAVAENLPAATAIMTAIAPGMASLSSVGYGLMAEYMQPVVIPVDADGRWQAAHQWRVYLEAA